MALRFLEKELQQLLQERGLGELAEKALGAVTLTDDGETLYVHVLPKQGWPGRASGRAYVLAWEDYAPQSSSRMYCYRWLVREARAAMKENIDRIARWLEGRPA